MAFTGNADLIPGRMVRRAGRFTKAAYLTGVGPREIEGRLGYRKGRLDPGWWLLFLTEMPGPDDFEVRSLGQGPAAATHGQAAEPPARPADLRRTKERLIAEVFSLKGSARLAKAVAKAGPLSELEEPDHVGDSGIPQWELRPDRALTWKVAAFLRAEEVYNGFFI